MDLPTRAFFGMIMGALALTGPAFADAMPGAIDPDKLVRIEDKNYVVQYEDWVATDPISSVTIKKIEAGRVTYVDVMKTATGTYSTDGLTSQNVLYPGIIVEPKARNYFSFSSWADGRWNRFRTYNGNSYVSVTSYTNHRGQTRTGTCISTASFFYC